MSRFNVIKTPIDGLLILEPIILKDDRGSFMRTFCVNDLKEAGINETFVQENQSTSRRGVIRGLHFQKKNPQGKLARVVYGEVFDVAVDIRKDSETFGKWFGVFLSAENKRQFYVPGGFAHGYLSLTEGAEFVYKCTSFYDPQDEGAIIWNDPDVAIDWNIPVDMDIILSEKDKSNYRLKDLKL